MAKKERITIKKDDTTYEWYEGSHTVNIYCGGKNTDVFSIGDFGQPEGTVSLAKFKKGVETHHKEQHC